MGKKDTIGKSYFRNTVRFAEFMNLILYHGEKAVAESKEGGRSDVSGI